MRNPYFVLKFSWYAGLFIVIGNSFYVEIYIRKKYTFKILGLESEFEHTNLFFNALLSPIIRVQEMHWPINGSKNRQKMYRLETYRKV